MNANIVVAVITAASSVAGAITALILNHRGFADLRSEMSHRFEDLHRYLDMRFAATSANWRNAPTIRS